MHDELKQLLKIAGAALEAEDRFLRKAAASNPAAYHNEKAGILRFNNEHYYQFVVARALVSSLRLAASIEVTSNDLALKDPKQPRPVRSGRNETVDEPHPRAGTYTYPL